MAPMKKMLNKIHAGDCLDFMKRLPSESIDLIVTSPPYNIRRSSGGGMRNGSGGLWENARLLDGYAGDNGDDMPVEQYINWQRRCVSAMMRVLRDDGAIFYNHKRRVQDGLLEDHGRQILSGFPVRQEIIWQRSGGINFNLGYLVPTYEVIFMVCKSKKFRLAKGNDPGRPKAACAYGDVWKIPQEFKNPHPAPFPIEIPRRCIEITDAKIVLDPFIGSGTTAIAAEMLGRSWIGIEIAKEYRDMAEERIAKWRASRGKTG